MRRRAIRTIPAKHCVLIVLYLAPAAYGQVLNESATLLAPNGGPGDEFGGDVAISGATILVGASQDADQGYQAGSAYVFHWNGSSWALEQKLLPSDLLAADEFGLSVSIFGSVAVVGAPEDDANGLNAGSVYVFRWNGSTWVFEQELLASDGAAGDRFGSGVAVFDNLIFVGASRDDDNGSYSGSAYAFRWTGSMWVQEQKLLPSDGGQFQEFGGEVAVLENVAFVGAPWAYRFGVPAGAAYVFHWNGLAWVESQKLVGSTGNFGDEFGADISLCDGAAIISGAGAATLFRRNGSAWAQEHRFQSGVIGEYFALDVAITASCGRVLISARNHPTPGTSYVFAWNGSAWLREFELQPSDAAYDDQFGNAAALFGDVAVVGAFGDGGSAYVFSLGCDPGRFGPVCVECPGGPMNPCNGHGTCDAGTAGLGTCTCHTGYAGLECDQCAPGYYNYPLCSTCVDPATCSGHGRCASELTCSCDAVFGGPTCNECATDHYNYPTCTFCDAAFSCTSNGICSPAGGCDCDPIYGGAACERCATDHYEYPFCRFCLASTTCSAHGVCNAGGACDCEHGYAGTGCELCDIDFYGYPDCVYCVASETCSAHGSCDVLGNCACGVRFSGTACDQCASNYYVYPMCTLCLSSTTCSGNGACNPLGGCDCVAGWLGAHCATDIDECAAEADNCDTNATCTNTPGGFACTCNPGYSGDGVVCAVISIPATSTWGLMILGLALLAASKASRHRTTATT